MSDDKVQYGPWRPQSKSKANGDDEGGLPRSSDEALALRFADRHVEELRYVAAWGKWFVWDGMAWRADDTLLAFSLAREVCREEAVQHKKSTAAGIASAKTVAAVERLARADRRLAATVDQWDADLWILNTPSGIADLRTGEVGPHRRDAYCTRVAAVTPGGECPTWLRFLDRVTAGDAELVGFIHRMLGYCLTGSIREHSLFFLFGTGANGKSVLLSTVSGILNDYAKSAPIETFVSSNADRHPTDLAGLRGARLVTAVETEEGRRWAESKIKALTGGDRIAARFMRQDFFEFVPIFKLLIAGNHKPGLRSVDEAIRRRLHLIPFSVTIPEAERDELLAEKLRTEWPGILRWMIEGAIEWGGDGLRPAESSREATDSYLDTEDALGQWLDECCRDAPNGFETTARLFDSWKRWAEPRSEFVGNIRRFSQALENRGLRRQRDQRTRDRGFAGICCIGPATQ